MRKEIMNTKPILVTFATRFGSTQEVAESIAKTLRETGLEVELQPMRAVNNLDAYDAAVLGAAIYGGHWHPDAHQFLAQHQGVLSQMPVAIFTLGPLNTSAGAMKNSLRQLDKELVKYPWLRTVALEIFVGKYDPSKLSFFEKFLPASDHRNWEAIRAWAKALAAQLKDGEKTGLFLNSL
jgi:menaquinone-dependent protoporphyrinogen oxidase